MLLEKYKPKKIEDIIGQKDVVIKIENWLKKWKSGKALLLYGPTGSGKTIISEIIAKGKKLNLLEVNTSDSLTAFSIRETLGSATKNSSLLRGRIILINDVDSLSSADRGGIAEIIKIIRESSYPIVLTADNAYDKKLKSLKNYCELVHLKKIPVNLIEKKLREIVLKEKLKVSSEIIRKIAVNSNGDIRSAINDLEVADVDMDYRDKEKDIFETLRTIFNSQDVRTAIQAIESCDKDIDEIFWWVEQNICNEYEKPEEIAAVFDLLSRADLFRSKVVINQNFRFKKYMRDLIAGISMIKKKQYHKFVMYRPPDRLIFLGRTKSSRKEMGEIYRNLGEFLHCSKRKVKEQLPYLKIILGKDFIKM